MKCVIHKYSMLYTTYKKRDPGWCSMDAYFEFNQQNLPIFVIRRHEPSPLRAVYMFSSFTNELENTVVKTHDIYIHIYTVVPCDPVCIH